MVTFGQLIASFMMGGAMTAGVITMILHVMANLEELSDIRWRKIVAGYSSSTFVMVVAIAIKIWL